MTKLKHSVQCLTKLEVDFLFQRGTILGDFVINFSLFMKEDSTIPPAKDTEPGKSDSNDIFIDLDWDDEEDNKPTQIVDMNEIMKDIDREQFETKEQIQRHAIILPPELY